MLKTLRIFEHETVHVGHECEPAGKGHAFTDADFETLVRFNDQHGGKFFRPGHRRLTATSFVGYLEAGRLAVEILPKADRHRHASTTTWRSGLLEMIGVATELRLEVLEDAGQATARSSLLDIVARHFVDEVEHLLHGGLAKGYREAEGNRNAFCGRLAFAEHIRTNVARADRFYVRYGTYDHDVLVNQILGLTLRLIGQMVLSNEVEARASRCRLAFPEVTEVRVRPEAFDRLRLARSTIRYRRALTLARMILEHRSPELRAGSSPVFALLFDMNTLWERYVASLFRHAAGSELLVSTQGGIGFWTAEGHRVRSVRPDIVVRRRSDRRALLVVDTKWKVVGDGPPADGDLKQMFVYNELLDAPRAMLVYPAASAARSRRGAFATRPGAGVSTHTCETVHLSIVEGERWSGERLQKQVDALVANAC